MYSMNFYSQYAAPDWKMRQEELSAPALVPNVISCTILIEQHYFVLKCTKIRDCAKRVWSEDNLEWSADMHSTHD